jgi:hypothetical protein
MDGGAVFHFAADGLKAVLARGAEAADGKDVRLGGELRPSGSTFARRSSMRFTWLFPFD